MNKKEKQQFIQDITKRAEQGEPEAQHKLGVLYSTKHTLPGDETDYNDVLKEDNEKAIFWWQKAAENERVCGWNEKAANILSYSYERCEIVEKDKEKAKYWKKKARKLMFKSLCNHFLRKK